MARYPTFEDYAGKGNYRDGIKRCDDLLKKNPDEPQLWIVKLRLVLASGQPGNDILERLASLPTRNIEDIVTIQNALSAAVQQDYPPPLTLDPWLSKIWDNAFKTSASDSHKAKICHHRFTRAVEYSRAGDAQQALIQLKSLRPKDRVVYLAHLAYTQLLSTAKDDMQSRLALLLARKTISERFDDDKALDCRVPGQVFALQASEKDLETISGRRFEDSKQVFEAGNKRNAETLVDDVSELAVADAVLSSPLAWLNAENSKLKRSFGKLVNSKASVAAFEEFVADVLKLHAKATAKNELKANRSLNTTSFLAISGLIQLHLLSNKDAFLLQAALVGWHLLGQNSHVHEARLILVYIYVKLGLGSLALIMYESLRVKEVQFDTVAFSMLTRISILHPFESRISNRESYVPYDKYQRLLAMYGRHERLLAETEAEVLEHGQTGMIFDVYELRKRLRLSLTRRIHIIEYRRIARLTGKGSGAQADQHNIGARKVANWLTFVDNRDFNATFNLGLNLETALHDLSDKTAMTQWLVYNLAADAAWCLIHPDVKSLTLDTDVLLQELADISASNKSLLPNAEHLTGEVYFALLSVLHSFQTTASVDAAGLDKVSTAMTQLSIDALVQTSDELAEHIRDHFLFVDALRTVHSAVSFLRTKTPDTILATLAELERLSRQKFQQLQNHAKAVGSEISSATILRSLKSNNAISKELFTLTHGTEGGFAEDVTASAQDAWAGLAKIMLP